jgi:hypothetical protein
VRPTSGAWMLMPTSAISCSTDGGSHSSLQGGRADWRTVIWAELRGLLPWVTSTTGRFSAACTGTANGQTIRTIAWAADVRQDRTLPENGTAANRGRQKLRFQTLHIAELGTFRRLTLPEIPSSLLLMCPTHSLLDICRSDSVLCRLAIVEF